MTVHHRNQMMVVHHRIQIAILQNASTAPNLPLLLFSNCTPTPKRVGRQVSVKELRHSGASLRTRVLHLRHALLCLAIFP